MTDSAELKTFLAERDALFLNPTLKNATDWWNRNRLPKPVRYDVPLAAVHKARLQWLDATDEMIKESMEWLKAHDYEVTMKGAPPLTPERRDADRATLGKPPLTPQS